MRLPRPPSADPLVALADQCVQCGLCLPACPTYRHDRIEAESPRGRIALVRGWALQALEPTPAGDTHLDHCLACRSCEAVCPAGVQYGALLLRARQRQRECRGARVLQRAMEWLTARPRALGIALSAYRTLWRLLPGAARPLPRPPRVASVPDAPPRQAPGTIALFTGCIARTYEAPTRIALARLLRAGGMELDVPPAQGCCGALHAHAGNAEAATALARRNVVAFAGSTTVVTLASGCHAALATALPAAQVSDALDLLASRLPQLRFRPCAERIALHLPCSQRNVVRSIGSLRRLLAAIPGLDIVELDDGYGCCGAAGTTMLTDTARAASFRAPLIAQLQASGATRLLSANIGCRLHLANGTAVPVQHPVDFLAECLDTSP